MIKGPKIGNDLFLRSPLQETHLSLNLRRYNRESAEGQGTAQEGVHREKAPSTTCSALRYLWTRSAALAKGEFDEAPQGSERMIPKGTHQG